MIRPNDQRPGRPRPPRVKTPRGGGSSGGGGGGTNKGWSLCPLAIVVPALTLAAACTVLLQHGP